MLALLVAGCAQPAREGAKPVAARETPALGALPATFVRAAECPGCQETTLTLRADASFLLRDQLGAAEFYDFGRWKVEDGRLELAGDRDTRRYALGSLRRAPKAEPLRGPFRMVGLYDGKQFRECRTGASWPFALTRAAQALAEEHSKQAKGALLVSLDAQLEGSPETLRMFRQPTVLSRRTCPG